ncbi:hypothetical protein VF21_07756 [Pseudogymnoascus sp. 05NY08]|nr:hypothetical protein VF21_07756 [Pseudogymnoascus sp. 05NY08]
MRQRGLRPIMGPVGSRACLVGAVVVFGAAPAVVIPPAVIINAAITNPPSTTTTTTTATATAVTTAISTPSPPHLSQTLHRAVAVTDSTEEEKSPNEFNRELSANGCF